MESMNRNSSMPLVKWLSVCWLSWNSVTLYNLLNISCSTFYPNWTKMQMMLEKVHLFPLKDDFPCTSCHETQILNSIMWMCIPNFSQTGHYSTSHLVATKVCALKVTCYDTPRLNKTVRCNQDFIHSFCYNKNIFTHYYKWAGLPELV